MKFLRKEAILAEETAEKLEEDYCKEVAMLAALHHDNIMKMLDTFDAGSHFCIVSELAEGKPSSFPVF